MNPTLMGSSSLQAVSFDLDGTLYDYDRHRVHLLPSLLRHPRVLLAYKEAVTALRGQRHPSLRAELDRRVGAAVGLPPEIARQALDRTVYGAWVSSFSPSIVRPGVRELMAALDRLGVPRVVVSDHPAERKLQRLGLEGWAAIVDAEAVGAFKPLPDALEAAAARLGLPSSAFVHIGDREDTDGGMASAAGASCLILGRDVQRFDQLSAALLGDRA
ncbi:HAD family hydrolase [Myxococcota bacterium]|nr:HAD family hydrolase [Myxococcota bacterium]